MAMGQCIEAGSLAFALPPVAIAKKNAYLLGQVVCQGAIKAPGAQFHSLLGQISQCASRRFLQIADARSVDHCADGHRGWGEAQKIKTVAQGFVGVVDAVHLVVRFGYRYRTSACADRTTAVVGLCQ
ncbi:hypothetical protein D9M68_719880 [compost metagenome]